MVQRSHIQQPYSMLLSLPRSSSSRRDFPRSNPTAHRGSGMATLHSTGYPTSGTGQASRDTQQLGAWILAFDADVAKRPSNTFCDRQHTLEAGNEDVYLQVSLEHSSIGYSPVGGSHGCRPHYRHKSPTYWCLMGERGLNSLRLTSGFELGPRLGE